MNRLSKNVDLICSNIDSNSKRQPRSASFQKKGIFAILMMMDDLEVGTTVLRQSLCPLLGFEIVAILEERNKIWSTSKRGRNKRSFCFMIQISGPCNFDANFSKNRWETDFFLVLIDRLPPVGRQRNGVGSLRLFRSARRDFSPQNTCTPQIRDFFILVLMQVPVEAGHFLLI